MRRQTALERVLLGAVLLVLGSCGEGRARITDGPVQVDVEASPPERLSSMRLFEWSPEGGFVYNGRVVPYDMNTPLFSDYALKERAIYVPEGAAATYDENGVFTFPVGTVIVKTFYFPADFRAPGEDLRLIETRVLMLTSEGWESWPYIWDEDQQDAHLAPSGETRAITFIDAEGVEQTSNYLVPQRNQCRSCHERAVGPGGENVQTPIGVRARSLNREHDYRDAGTRNQLEYLAELGMLDEMPSMDAVPAAFDFRRIEREGVASLTPAEVDRAARDYLDVNCAHCHDPSGVQGVTSQLFLNHDNTDTFRLGVCKRPGSAGEGTFGLDHDITPGHPDLSILYRRLETTRVGAMMPLVGRSLRHDPAAELIYSWIQAMPPAECTPAPDPAP
jgi:uncharacterized repeat protein (TIGR03806 family)